jgi:uncharacterized SAM-binding protein YcdF (DUF218 family)
VARALGRIFLAVAALALLAVVFHNSLLKAAGSYLVRTDPPRKADIGIVLGGDYSGGRILTAAQLVRQGYAPRLLISGPAGFYGEHECDLAVPFAEKAGYPASYFVHFENDAHSTAEEARDFAPELRGLGVHSVLLVTSNYHTRRAGNTFRAAMPDLQFLVESAPDESFTPDGWWHSREGRKTALIEWMKTVATWLHL